MRTVLFLWGRGVAPIDRGVMRIGRTVIVAGSQLEGEPDLLGASPLSMDQIKSIEGALKGQIEKYPLIKRGVIRRAWLGLGAFIGRPMYESFRTQPDS